MTYVKEPRQVSTEYKSIGNGLMPKASRCPSVQMAESIRSNPAQVKGKHSDKNEPKNKLAENDNYDVFAVGDIVWAKVKGWSIWPANVILILIYS